MNIEKIKKIQSDIANEHDNSKREALKVKLRYAYSKDKNTVSTFRANEISRRVQEKYSIDKQLEILYNADPSEIALVKEYRANVTIEVDTLITTLDAEINAELEA